MKKIVITIFVLSITIFGCSSDDSKETSATIPEKFLIKLEIKSLSGSSPKTSISINGTGVKEWTNIKLPFTNEYTYVTKGDELQNTSCKCITISAWAYLSKIDNIESFNLYVDGKLVDSKKTVAASEPNGIMNPTILEFVYKP